MDEVILMSIQANMVGYSSSIRTMMALSKMDDPYKKSKSHKTTKIYIIISLRRRVGWW